MSRLRRAAFGAVKVAAAAADVARSPADGLVVLIYHRVGGCSGLEVDLPTELFDAQCAHLAATANVLRLDDAIDALLRGAALPPRAVALTFDDGTADFADNAVPALARHGVPATLYVATAFVEEQRPFPDNGVPLTWAALGEALASGVVDIGSHTHTHRVLGTVDAAEAADELDRSIALIGERLDVTASHFAYPKGVAGSPAADAAVRARFRSASIGGGRANRPDGDVHALLRTPVQVSDGMRWFMRKARGGMAFEDVLRRWLNVRRYADAIT